MGCIVSGYLMDAIGRRRTLIITEVPLIIGWLMVAFAQNVPMMYVGESSFAFSFTVQGMLLEDPFRKFTSLKLCSSGKKKNLKRFVQKCSYKLQ